MTPQQIQALENKAIFKIFNKTTRKYMSRSRSKSSWRTLAWAQTALHDFVKESWSRVSLQDLELHFSY